MSRFRGNGRGAQQEAPPPQNGNGQSDRSPPCWSRKSWVGAANVEVAVFEKLLNGGTQNERVTYTISCKRTYKDDKGNYQTAPFWGEDLPVLASLLLQAHAWITEENHRE